MKKLLKSIEPLIQEELERANKKFPQFASAHEGWAVMLEEYQEVQEELNQVHTEFYELWRHIKRNDTPKFLEQANYTKTAATNLIAEATQLAAMAQKFIDMLEREEK